LQRAVDAALQRRDEQVERDAHVGRRRRLRLGKLDLGDVHCEQHLPG